MKHYPNKVCLLCGKEFTPTSPSQKYCSECAVVHLYEVNKQWRKMHPEQMRESLRNSYYRHRKERLAECKQYRTLHPEKVRQIIKQWSALHPDKIKEYDNKWYYANRDKKLASLKQWKKQHPDETREQNRKHIHKRKRNLGFIPLNEWQEGYEAHHIDLKHIIYMPKEIHKSIYHNLIKGTNMHIINALAIEYLGGGYYEVG
jgi:hypothetical protein